MIIKSIWVEPLITDHPELNDHHHNCRLLAIKFLEENSLEALKEKAERLRSLEFFNEPYDPPEYLQ
jgi:hypothetical protein